MALSFREFKLTTFKKGWITLILFFAILSFFLVHFFWQQQEMNALQHQKQLTLTEIEELKESIAYFQQALSSLDDPKWIEQQMIEKLGVVPRGYKLLVIEESHPP